MKNNSFKTIHGEMTFDSNHCFLCGSVMTSETKSDEHIFPKWLQKRNNLWNQKLSLLNGSGIPYKNLVVPCCKECNNVHLSNIENEIRSAFSGGIDSVRNLDKKIIYKWIIKIMYSLIYKQLYLKHDRKNKNSKKIITPEILKKYHMIFNYMQSIVKKIEFNDDFSSVFIFEVLDNQFNIEDLDFFYVDDINNLQFAIRSKEIGIICTLGDGNAIHSRLNSYFTPFFKMPLEEVQFRQLIADVFYNKYLLNNKPSAIITENLIHQIPSWNYSYKEFNYKEYAYVLYQIQQGRFKFEDLYDERNDAVMNFLVDENSRIIIHNGDGTYKKGKEHTSFEHETFGDKTIELSME